MAADMERGGNFTIASAPSLSSTLPPTSPSPKAGAPKPKPATPPNAAPTPPPHAVAATAPPPKPAAPPIKAAAAVPKVAPTPPSTSISSVPKAELSPAAPPKDKSWLVQIGAYGSEAAARKVWSDVSKAAAAQGKSPVYIAVGSLTRLRAGPFAGKAEANQACQSLQKSGFNCFPVAP
jgi:cell division septation protein DedD